MLALSAADPSLGRILRCHSTGGSPEGFSCARFGDAALGDATPIALAVGLLLLIARFAGRRFRTSDGAPIQVVHRQALGRGQGVAVVAVGTRVLVLGTTEQQVTLLAEVEPDEVGLDLAPNGLGVVPVDEESPDAPQVATAARTGQGPLAGSLLSAQTWKQTFDAVSGKRAS